MAAAAAGWGSPALPLGSPIGFIGWYHLAFFGVFIPWAAYRSRLRVAALKAYPPLQRHLVATLGSLVFLGGISLLVAWKQDVRLRPAAPPTPVGVLAGVVLLVTAVAVALPMWRSAVLRKSRGVYFKMPRTAGEKAAWIAVSLAAGFFEECAWRGVQTSLLTAVLGNAWLAVIVCALMFALAHANQSVTSMAFIFGLSIALGAIVALTGSLVVPILVHATFDVIAGFTYARLGTSLGYTPPPLAPAVAPRIAVEGA